MRLIYIEHTTSKKPKPYAYPREWAEVKRQQLLAYAHHVEQFRKEIFRTEEDGKTVTIADERLFFRAHCALLQSGLEMPVSAFARLHHYQLLDLINEGVNDFFFHQEPKVLDLPSPKLRPERLGARYHGPTSFHKVAGEEYSFAEAFFLKYHMAPNATERLSALAGLAAVLYRPKVRGYDPTDPSTTGDIREPFNRHTLDARIKKFSGMPFSALALAMLWFQTHRAALPQRFPHLFTGEESESRGEGWIDVFLALSRGSLPEYDDVLQKPVILIMTELERRAREVEEAKKDLKKDPKA